MITASFLINYLEKSGWKQIRQEGTHQILEHPGHPNLLSIPDPGNEGLNPRLVNAIFQEAGLKARVHKEQFNPKRMITVIKQFLGTSR